MSDGNNSFSKITEGEIVNDETTSMGSSLGDFNGDGLLDIFIPNASNVPNFLYSNNGDGTFTKIIDGDLATDSNSSLGASWADIDNDGHLDIFVSNASNQQNNLYRNNGDGTFTKIIDGDIVNENSNSFGCSWGDIDNDGDLDLFVANGQNNFLYENNGNSTFLKVTSSPVVTEQANSRGGSFGDFDNDGDLDLFVANFGNNFLYKNLGDGIFSKITEDDVVNDNSDSRGSLWIDFDNDGDLDLYVSNASSNLFYLNDGDGSFTQILLNQDVNVEAVTNGAFTADVNKDGYPDFFVANFSSSEGNFLFRNNGGANNWLNIQPIGTVSNRSAIGTRVRVKSSIDGKQVWQMREISAQSGFAGQNSLHAAFGLGDATIVDSMKIEWPSGIREFFTDVSVNQFLVIHEDSLATSVGDGESAIPKDFALEQNYPNPFNPTTTIRFSIPEKSRVKVKVYDLLGRLVANLFDRETAPGKYEVTWHAKGQPSGIYIYRLETTNSVQSRKLLLLK